MCELDVTPFLLIFMQMGPLRMKLLCLTKPLSVVIPLILKGTRLPL